MVTISVPSFSFLLILPVLTMGIGMWLMSLTSSPASYEHEGRTSEEAATSPIESQDTLPETRWRQVPGKLT